MITQTQLNTFAISIKKEKERIIKLEDLFKKFKNIKNALITIKTDTSSILLKNKENEYDIKSLEIEMAIENLEKRIDFLFKYLT